MSKFEIRVQSCSQQIVSNFDTDFLKAGYKRLTKINKNGQKQPKNILKLIPGKDAFLA